MELVSWTEADGWDGRSPAQGHSVPFSPHPPLTGINSDIITCDTGQLFIIIIGPFTPGPFTLPTYPRAQPYPPHLQVDAEETVASLIQDEQAGRLPAVGGEGGGGGAPVDSSGSSEQLTVAPLPELLARRGVTVVDFAGWMRLDRVEREAGDREGRIRAKVTGLDEMLRVAAGGR